MVNENLPAVLTEILDKLKYGQLTSDEAEKLINDYSEKLLIDDFLNLLRIEGFNRTTSFKFAQLMLSSGLEAEPLQVLLPHLDSPLRGDEIFIYFDAILASGDVERLMNFYFSYESIASDHILRIIDVLQEFGETSLLAELIQNEMGKKSIKGEDPISSIRKYTRRIKGEYLYELQHMINLEDQWIDLKVAKALNKFGLNEEARQKVLPYCFAGLADAIAIYANSFSIDDYLNNRMTLSNEWLQALVKSKSYSFQAVAFRIAAFQLYSAGNLEESIKCAERAAQEDDLAAHFLIYVLRHNRNFWIKLLKKRSNARLELEISEKYGRAPTSDLDSNIRADRTKSIKEIKREFFKDSQEEVWECRYAVYKRQSTLTEGGSVPQWSDLVCDSHQEGTKRLQERGLLPPLDSPIWNSFLTLNLKDYQDFDFDRHGHRDGRSLWPWQIEAIKAWTRHGRVGMVEAATGSGKSEVGIAIAKEALSMGKAVVLVVPRKLLQEQWKRNFIRAGLGQFVDTFGGDISSIYPRTGKAKQGRILITLVQSLSKYVEVIPEFGKGVLIADEIHLYTGKEYSKVFSDNFIHRIGLTATLPDSVDDRNLLRNYFSGDPVFVYSIPKAIADGVILPYEMMIVRVQPTPEEEAELYQYAVEVENCFKELARIDAISREFKNFDLEIAKLEELERFPDITKRYRDATSKTDQILARFSSNGIAVQQMAPIFKRRGKALIFSDFVETMNRTIDVLTTSTVNSQAIDGSIVGSARDEIIDELRNGEIDAIVSPQAMDVGVDIPELEVGMYVGVRRERLNLIQRLGRFLRISPGKSIPIICIPIAIGHNDDPLVIGNENLQKSAFHYIAENALQPINIFDVNDSEGIKEFLELKSPQIN